MGAWSMGKAAVCLYFTCKHTCKHACFEMPNLFDGSVVALSMVLNWDWEAC